MCNTTLTNASQTCANISSHGSWYGGGFPEIGISKQQADTAIFVLECIIFPCVTIFGVTGNILSLVVLCNKRMLHANAVLLVTLSISDSLFLVANIVRKSKCVADRVGVSGDFYTHSFIVLFYLKTVLSRVTTWLVVAISTERLIVVALPLKVAYIVTKRRMAAVVFLIVVLTFSFFSVFPLQVSIKYNNGKPYISPSPLYLENLDLMDNFNQYVLPILFRWVPKFLVIVCNAWICWVMMRKDRSEIALRVAHRSSRQMRDQKRLTRMLLILAAVFVVCLLPGDAFIIAQAVQPDFNTFKKYHYLYTVLSDVSLLFEMINSSVNFLIYMATNSTFSSLYVDLLCPCMRREARPKSPLEQLSSLPNSSGTTPEQAIGYEEETVHHYESFISILTDPRGDD